MKREHARKLPWPHRFGCGRFSCPLMGLDWVRLERIKQVESGAGREKKWGRDWPKSEPDKQMEYDASWWWRRRRGRAVEVPRCLTAAQWLAIAEPQGD